MSRYSDRIARETAEPLERLACACGGVLGVDDTAVCVCTPELKADPVAMAAALEHRRARQAAVDDAYRPLRGG